MTIVKENVPDKHTHKHTNSYFINIEVVLLMLFISDILKWRISLLYFSLNSFRQPICLETGFPFTFCAAITTSVSSEVSHSAVISAEFETEILKKSILVG